MACSKSSINVSWMNALMDCRIPLIVIVNVYLTHSLSLISWPFPHSHQHMSPIHATRKNKENPQMSFQRIWTSSISHRNLIKWFKKSIYNIHVFHLVYITYITYRIQRLIEFINILKLTNWGMHWSAWKVISW